MRRLPQFLALAAVVALGCNSEGTSEDDPETGVYETTDCSDATGTEAVVCATDNFLATLSDTEQETVLYAYSDSVDKTYWSNLPGVQRSGITYGDLSDESMEALLDLAAVVFSDEGYDDFVGGLAGDDYLAGLEGGGGGGPGPGGYGSDTYIVAIFGTPSTTEDWMLQLGGHHMAHNVTYADGGGYPTPHHQGLEPKSEFVLDGETYAPMSDEGDAFVALFDSLDSTELSAAYLDGQSFADVVLGPVEFGTGTLDAVTFPSGSNRGGLLVSDLDADQQALVIAAMEAWVRTYDASIADDLMAAYTTDEAFADTLIAWGGNASGPDIDVNGTYFRIDGPRVWIEMVLQNGVLVRDQTHFHTMYRDKDFDYGGAL